MIKARNAFIISKYDTEYFDIDLIPSKYGDSIADSDTF